LECYRYRINVFTVLPPGSMTWMQKPLRPFVSGPAERAV
jgi:hypothetical protein